MEELFESVTGFEFQERFPDEVACMYYLSQMKWTEGIGCSNKK